MLASTCNREDRKNKIKERQNINHCSGFVLRLTLIANIDEVFLIVQLHTRVSILGRMGVLPTSCLALSVYFDVLMG